MGIKRKMISREGFSTTQCLKILIVNKLKNHGMSARRIAQGVYLFEVLCSKSSDQEAFQDSFDGFRPYAQCHVHVHNALLYAQHRAKIHRCVGSMCNTPAVCVAPHLRAQCLGSMHKAQALCATPRLYAQRSQFLHPPIRCNSIFLFVK